MNYGKIIERDIANGAGIRVSLFVSGCRNHCDNCFQPETWNFDYGKKFTDDTIERISGLLEPSYIDGITLLGGDPMEPENQSELLRTLRILKSRFPEKNVWCYTGYTIEKLLCDGEHCRCDYTDELLSMIDILIDGKFVEDLKDITLKFRGSSNQRLIDVKETLSNKRIIEANIN